MLIRHFIIYVAVVYTVDVMSGYGNGWSVWVLLVCLFVLVQLNTNRIFVVSVLLAALMVNDATAGSSELLWDLSHSCSQSSLLLGSL